ncbi:MULTISPECIES: hypothetical protein [Mammaliicoccus]|uniref:hypothetical protein n=1 Tax=Mammaliicoccus TaxID=2803850 RepID=UPI0013014797|nr:MULTISPECIES: hypothetical protein [Mammaliicoccus]
MIKSTIQSLRPYVKNRNDFYNVILPTGLTPKETLDKVIYKQVSPVRGSYYCYFANRV